MYNIVYYVAREQLRVKYAALAKCKGSRISLKTEMAFRTRHITFVFLHPYVITNYVIYHTKLIWISGVTH